jgi:hypothetical protein
MVIAKLPLLTRLMIKGIDSGLQTETVFPSLAHLEWLSIDTWGFTDDHFDEMLTSPASESQTGETGNQLVHLSVLQDGVSAEMIQSIERHCLALKSLAVAPWAVDPYCPLCQLIYRLEALHLDSEYLNSTDDFTILTIALSQCSNLRSLVTVSVIDCPVVTKQWCCPSLTSLAITKVGSLGLAGMPQIAAGSPNLVSLKLPGLMAHASTALMSDLHGLWPELQQIDLTDHPFASLAGLLLLLVNRSKLRRIYLAEDSCVTAEERGHVLSAYPHVEFLTGREVFPTGLCDWRGRVLK